MQEVKKQMQDARYKIQEDDPIYIILNDPVLQDGDYRNRFIERI